MNQNQAKELLPIIKAFSEGKVIQIKQTSGEWIRFSNISFDGNPKFYRIKPEPKYRSFKNAEECWNEMLKHQPFGWVKNKRNDKDPEVFIHCGVIKGDWILTDVDEEPFPFDKIYNNYTFVDGTPFGVKMEE